MKNKCSILLARCVMWGVALAGAVSSQLPALSADKNLPSIMSLDYCADQFVLLLSEKSQISVVSDTAEDIFSFYRKRAQGLKTTRGTIEDVLMLKPDLALQTYNSATRMAEMTKRSHITLVETKYGSDPKTVFKNVEMLGALLHQEEKAAEFIGNYKKRLEYLERQPESEIKIVYITPSGVTAGAGTSVDDIIKLAGFKNYTAEHGYSGWVNLPMEILIADPPDALITSFFETGATNQSSWSLGRHDFIYDIMKKIPTADLPSSHMSCNGLFLVDAAELIRNALINDKIGTGTNGSSQ